MESWAKAKGPIVRFRVLGTQGLVISDPILLKRIFQTRFKIYAKDLTMSYHPFMPILGTGLVTADGDLWQKQRTLMGPALRIDILDDIVGIAQRCADRLADKLEQYRWGGGAVVLGAGACRVLCTVDDQPLAGSCKWCLRNLLETQRERVGVHSQQQQQCLGVTTPAGCAAAVECCTGWRAACSAADTAQMQPCCLPV